MNLREAITEQEEGYLYIGSNSAFVWIGKKQDALRELEVASNEYYRILRDVTIPGVIELISRREKRKEQLQDNIYILRSNLEQQDDLEEKERTQKSLDFAIDELERLKTSIPTAKMMLRKHQAYFENWKDFLDREVKEIYPHKYVKPLGMTIIFEGTEQGKYWSYDEMPCKEGRADDDE